MKSNHKFRHGVVVTRGGAVVAIGYNHCETHAEYHALSKLWPSERRGLTLWSVRISNSGKLNMARPCPTCMELLKKSGIRKVYFSNSKGEIELEKVG
jgi:pyrimidine deaminase RibD-like protein